jgi:UDP-N-acetylmuramoylalanine--D-glutamate ligase
MVPYYPVKDKNFVVFGLARSGMAAVRWLIQHGAQVYAVDSDVKKQHQAAELGAKIKAEHIDWSTIAALVQSPGITPRQDLSRLASDKGVPIITDCNLLRFSQPKAHFIGVTGTNGKSTTTTLIGHILAKAGEDVAIGGNLGVPALDLPVLPGGGIYVLELSSYQLELSDPLSLTVAAWLNLSEDHLERHGSMAHYVEAKKRIFLQQGRQKTQAVIGVDDEWSKKIYRELLIKQPDKVMAVSCQDHLAKGIFVKGHRLVEAYYRGEDCILDLRGVKHLKGQHNYQNIAIAYGVCRSLGLNKDLIVQGILSFPGLAHRQEVIAVLNDITFINDSKATNADAAAKALETFDQIYWILGGQAKTDGIEALQPYFNKICHAFLIGNAQERFAATLQNQVPFTYSGSLEIAVQQAYQLACQAHGKPATILLSPACASFDQFRDFEHRGEVFREAVKQLESQQC